MKSCWHRGMLLVTMSLGLIAADIGPAWAQGGDLTNFDGQLDGQQDVSGVMRLDRIGSDFRVRHFVGGQSTGYQDDATSLEIFRPFWFDNLMWFGDGRVSITNDSRVVGNGGFGFRQLSSDGRRTYGMNAWVDADDRTPEMTFMQVGFGLESLGEVWDFRSNFYQPIGDDQYLSAPVLSPLRFEGNNLFFTSTTTGRAAMEGVDLEAGALLPWLPENNLRGYLGGYFFQANDSADIKGVRGRLEGTLYRDVGVMLTVQNDDRYDTTAVVALSWTFSRGGRDDSSSYQLSLRDRMGRPVERNYQIMVDNQRFSEEKIATDFTTGIPIFVIHADSNAPAGGDGTVEMPFRTLSDAGSMASNIVFAHEDSLFTDSITLQAGQRFLGEGVLHTADTREFVTDTNLMGTVPLPRATDPAGAQPIIRTAAGNAVTLAANTEVSGFAIDMRPGTGSAIFTDGFAGTVDINRNTITSTSAADAIRILNVVGDMSFADNLITTNPGRGIFLSTNTGDVTITGGTINSTTGTALELFGNSGDLIVTGTTINQTGGQAVLIDGGDAADILDFTGSTINANSGGGIIVQNSAADGVFTEVNITNAMSDAITLDTNTGTYTFSNIDVATNAAGANGLIVNNSGTVNVIASADGPNVINTNGGPAVNITDTAIGFEFDNLSSMNSTAQGIVLNSSSGTFSVTGVAMVDDSTGNSIDVRDSDMTAGLSLNFANTTISGAGIAPGSVGHGIFLLDNPSSDFAFGQIDVMTDNGGGIVATNSGSISVTGGTIDANGGPAIDIDPTVIDITLDSVASTNSTVPADGSATGTGIRLDDVSGTFNVLGQTTISNSAEEGIHVANLTTDTASINFAGDVEIDGSAGSSILLQNITSGGATIDFDVVEITRRDGIGFEVDNVDSDIDFGTATIDTPAAGNTDAGIVVRNSTADFSFDRLEIADSGGDGVFLLNNNGGSFTVSSGDSTVNSGLISNAAGTAFNVDGGSMNVNFQADIENTAGQAIRVANTTVRADGTPSMVNFPITGLIFDTGGEGIEIDNVQGDVVISNAFIANSTTNGITVTGGTGNISFDRIDVVDSAGIGFSVEGGSANIDFDGNSNIFNNTMNDSRLVSIRNTTGGIIDMRNSFLSDDGGLGVLIENVSGDLMIDGTSIDNTAAMDSGGNAVAAFEIIGGATLNGRTPTYRIVNSNLTNSGGAGLTITGSQATIDYTGTIFGTTGNAFVVNGGRAVIDYSGSIINTSGRAVSIENTLGGSVDFTGGGISDTGAQGIFISGNQGSVDMNSNPNLITNSQGVAAVQVLGNSGPITLRNLLVSNDQTSNQPGLVVANNSSFSLLSANGIQVENARAVDVSNSRVNMQLQFVSATLDAPLPPGAVFDHGIVIENSRGNFTITGDFDDIATNGTGGTIDGTTQEGISIVNFGTVDNPGTVMLDQIQVLNSGNEGLLINGVTNFTMNRSNIGDNNGHGISLTTNGLDPDSLDGVGGVVRITENNNFFDNNGDGILLIGANGNDDDPIRAFISGNRVTSMLPAVMQDNPQGIVVRSPPGSSLFVDVINNSVEIDTNDVTNAGIDLRVNGRMDATLLQNDVTTTGTIRGIQASTQAAGSLLQLTVGSPGNPTLGNIVGDSPASQFRFRNTGGVFRLEGDLGRSPMLILNDYNNRTRDPASVGPMAPLIPANVATPFGGIDVIPANTVQRP